MADKLELVAREYKRQLETRILSLTREIAEFEDATDAEREELAAEFDPKKAKLDLETASVAFHRPFHFRSYIGGHWQCPFCYVRDDIQRSMIAVSNHTGDADIFRCRNCGHEYTV